jgi:hypothetical protein
MCFDPWTGGARELVVETLASSSLVSVRAGEEAEKMIRVICTAMVGITRHMNLIFQDQDMVDPRLSMQDYFRVLERVSYQMNTIRCLKDAISKIRDGCAKYVNTIDVSRTSFPVQT